jgi:hypothetical protein
MLIRAEGAQRKLVGRRCCRVDRCWESLNKRGRQRNEGVRMRCVRQTGGGVVGSDLLLTRCDVPMKQRAVEVGQCSDS